MAELTSGHGPDDVVPVDLDQLDTISEGDAVFEKVLIDSFFTSVGDSIERLENNLNSGNLVQCQRDAHKIKGASATMGARELCRLAMELEENFRDQDGNHAGEMVMVLKDEYEKVRRFLELRLHQDSGGSQS